VDGIDIVEGQDEYRVWIDMEAERSGERDVHFYLPKDIASNLVVGQKIEFAGSIDYVGTRGCHVGLVDVVISSE
jgi:hypothetical protein